MTLIDYLNRKADLECKLQVIDAISHKYSKIDAKSLNTESIIIYEGLRALYKETEKELKKIEKKLGV